MKLFHPILAGATLAERTAACAGVFAAIALTAEAPIGARTSGA